MNVKRIVALACALLAALTVAACGSSSKSSSSPAASPSTSTPAASTPTSATTAASTTTTAASGPAFKLGFICSCSGAQAAVFINDNKVAQAWASSVNAGGGINGHPVQLFTQDDGGTPSTSLQDVKQLVEQDHVQAIVGDMSLADQAWEKYIAGKGIPVIGGISDEAPMLTDPDFFPSGTQLVVSTVGVALQAKAIGAKHLGVIYCAESPICAQLDPLAKLSATLAGLKYSSGKILATAPSYAAPCLQLKSEGVDALYVADNSPVVLRFVDQCAQQGFKPHGAYNISGLSNDVLSDPNMNGAVMAAGNANPFDPSLPAVAQFQAVLNKYIPGFVSSKSFAFPAMLTWSAGKLFEAAAKAGNLTPTSSSADIKKGLYALKGETLGGIAPPLTFTPGKPAFVTCYFTQKVSSGKFTSLNGNKPSCLSAAQVTAVGAALKQLG